MTNDMQAYRDLMAQGTAANRETFKGLLGVAVERGKMTDAARELSIARMADYTDKQLCDVITKFREVLDCDADEEEA